MTHEEKVAELDKAFHEAVRRQMRAEGPPEVVATPGGAIEEWRGMSFGAALAESIRAGRKTQTRRPMRPQPWAVTAGELGGPIDADGQRIDCPLATEGGGLYVREPAKRKGDGGGFVYAADGASGCLAASYTPRESARTFLRVTAVRCQRLHAITPDEARAEGMPDLLHDEPTLWFASVWDRFYSGELAWDANPWIWAITFELTDERPPT